MRTESERQQAFMQTSFKHHAEIIQTSSRHHLDNKNVSKNIKMTAKLCSDIVNIEILLRQPKSDNNSKMTRNHPNMVQISFQISSKNDTNIMQISFKCCLDIVQTSSRHHLYNKNNDNSIKMNIKITFRYHSNINETSLIYYWNTRKVATIPQLQNKIVQIWFK